MKRLALFVLVLFMLPAAFACGPSQAYRQAQEGAIQARLDAKAVEADRYCPEEWQAAEEAMRLAAQWEERQDWEAAARFYRFCETAYRTAQRRAADILLNRD